MPRSGADRADSQTVIAAQQNGQWPCGSSSSTASCTSRFHCDHLLQMAVAIDRRLPGIRRAVQVAAVEHLQAPASSAACSPATRKRLRAHRGAACTRADVGGRADQADGAQGAAGRRGSCGRASAWAGVGPCDPSSSPPNRSFGSCISGTRSMGVAKCGTAAAVHAGSAAPSNLPARSRPSRTPSHRCAVRRPSACRAAPA